MLKTINDPVNSDAVGVEEAKRIGAELEPFNTMTPNKLVQIGRDLPGFKDRIKQLRARLYNAAKRQYESINAKMPDLVDPPPVYTSPTAGETSRSVEEIDAEIEAIKRQIEESKRGAK